MPLLLQKLTPSHPKTIAALLSLLMILILAIVWGAQTIGGYSPCELCLKERNAYYIAIPLMIAAYERASKNINGKIVRILFLLTAFLMFYNSVLSLYHAGVEYKFWEGPSSCTASMNDLHQNAATLIDALSNTTAPVACDVAAGRFLGLSFAGWGAIASLVLGMIALWGTFKRQTNPPQ